MAVFRKFYCVFLQGIFYGLNFLEIETLSKEHLE